MTHHHNLASQKPVETTTRLSRCARAVRQFQHGGSAKSGLYLHLVALMRIINWRSITCPLTFALLVAPDFTPDTAGNSDVQKVIDALRSLQAETFREDVIRF